MFFFCRCRGHRMSFKRVIDEENNESESKKQKRNAPEENMTILQKLFKDSPIIHSQNKDGDTPLHHASKTGQINVVIELLKCGVAIDTKNNKKYTPLHLAAMTKHEEIVNVLLDHGADINAKNEYGRTPLHLAAANGFCKTVPILLKRGANVNALDDSQSTPLHYAFVISNCSIYYHTCSGILKQLLAHDGIDPGLKNKHGKTALQLFIKSRPTYDELIHLKHLLTKFFGYPPGNFDILEMAEFIKEPKFEMVPPNDEMSTFLHSATINGHLEVVAFLLKIGVDVNLLSDGMTPLHCAVRWGKGEIVEFLLKSGADPNIPTRSGDTALHCASDKDYVEIVSKLLQMGANVNAANSQGETPLHAACEYQNVNIIKELLNHGANINVQFKSNGRTPLHQAMIYACKEPEEILRIFLQNRGDINFKLTCNKGLTILDLAIQKNYNIVARMIAKRICPTPKITDPIYPLSKFF